MKPVAHPFYLSSRFLEMIHLQKHHEALNRWFPTV